MSWVVEQHATAIEELQSTNEEMETTVEELRAANSELATLNAELESRTSELNRLDILHGSMVNSLERPLKVLDRDGVVTTCNQASEWLWGLPASMPSAGRCSRYRSARRRASSGSTFSTSSASLSTFRA